MEKRSHLPILQILQHLQKFSWRNRFLISLLLILSTTSTANPPDPSDRDGLFATLETSAGTICIDLLVMDAPRTVANFITLAEGSRSWFDSENNRISNEPFYDGRIFHRVFADTYIQTGAQANAVGPGYTFRDEFSTNALHDVEGVVSMANAGPDTNGSQFFITLRPIPEFDFNKPPEANQNTVFGRVEVGLDVARAISRVAVNSVATPVEPVTIERVTIVRQGQAALAFNPTGVQPPLPRIEPARVVMLRSENGLELTWPATSGNVLVLGTRVIDSWNVQPNAFTADRLLLNNVTDAFSSSFFSIVDVISAE